MSGTDRYLLPLLGVLALAWLGLALYVLLTRIAHNVVAAVLLRAQQLVVRGGTRDRAGFVRRLPRRLLERAVADASTPAQLSEYFAAHLLEAHYADIVEEARATSGRKRWRQARALRILTRARADVAVELLEEAIGSKEEELVAAAVALLGELGDERSSGVLVRALRDNDFARSRIAAQLDESQAQIQHLLVPLVRDPDAQVRYWGVTLLARYAGRPEIDHELARSALDAEASVRAAAVESLAARDAPPARLTAMALLQDPVWFVRAHAARALRSLEGDNGPAIAPLLADESWWVRAAAKEALEASPAAALELLLAYLDHEDEFARNGAAEVLQNTGALDSLLAEGAEIPAPAKRILAAGGRRLAATAAARNGLDPERLEQLAAASK